ncbi:MAG: hypothetical protein AAF637_17265 [Pseudomonadota bacterium]
MRRLVVSLAVLVNAAAVQAQGKANVEIVNERQRALQVRVFDRRCEAWIYQGNLIHEATVSVDCCADSGGRCNLSVYERPGHRHDYKGVLGTIFLRGN